MSQRGQRRERWGLRLGAVLGLLVMVISNAAAPAGIDVAASTPVAATPVATGQLAVEGDPIAALVLTPPESEAVYVVGGNGLYRSQDGGRSPEARGPVPPPGRVVAAGEADLLLAGDHPPCARGGDEPLLQRSDDGGATWSLVEGANGIRPLTVEIDEQLALGASCGGGQVSTDGGLTWQAAGLAEPGYEIMALASVVGGEGVEALVIGTSQGGTGRLWRVDLSEPTQPDLGSILQQFWGTGAVAGQGERIVLGKATGVATSPDGGETWQESRSGLEEVTVSVDPLQQPIPDAEAQRGFGIGAVAIAPNNPERLFAGTDDGLYESTDGGQTWLQVDGVEGLVTQLVMTPDASRLFVETESGVAAIDISEA